MAMMALFMVNSFILGSPRIRERWTPAPVPLSITVPLKRLKSPHGSQAYGGRTMRFSTLTRASAGAEGPIWSRPRKRKRRVSASLVNTLLVLLALIGALTLVLSIRAGSVETAGRTMDGWIATAWAHGQALIGRTPSPSR
jgi:hypothetical protein